MKGFTAAVLMVLSITSVNAQYRIDRFVTGNGGGKLAGPNFIINGTAGQPFTGNIQSQLNQVSGGFWYSYSALTGIKENDAAPGQYMLYQNFPNPFNPSTKIKYDLPEASTVTLKIYNILGEVEATLVNGMQNSGVYEVNWNAASYASGFYICRIEAGKYVQTRKMILLK